MADREVVFGVERICGVFEFSEAYFYRLVTLGFPANKVGGKWVCHVPTAKSWFADPVVDPGTDNKGYCPLIGRVCPVTGGSVSTEDREG